MLPLQSDVLFSIRSCFACAFEDVKLEFRQRALRKASSGGESRALPTKQYALSKSFLMSAALKMQLISKVVQFGIALHIHKSRG